MKPDDPVHAAAGLSSDSGLAQVITAAAFQGEALVSLVRAVTCAFLLFRFLRADPAPAAASVVNLLSLGVAIAFSVWLLGRIREQTADYCWLRASVSVDAGVCFAILLQRVLGSSAGDPYEGLLTLPDVSALLVVACAAGFRVWPRLAVQGALLNLLSLLSLLAVERAVHGDRLGYGVAQVPLVMFLLGGIPLLPLAAALRSRLVMDSAAATVRIQRARCKLGDLAGDHDKARSLVSAAAASSELMLRAVEQQRGVGVPVDVVKLHGERLRLDLAAARGQLAELGEQAYDQLTALSDVETVETTRVVREAIEALRWRFPGLRIDADLDGVPDVAVAGGAASVQRILFNLVNTARGADGRAGASRVAVRATAGDGLVRLMVEDDGPGLGGLAAISELLTVSGGTVHKYNRRDGGAGVCLTLLSVESAGVRSG